MIIQKRMTPFASVSRRLESTRYTKSLLDITNPPFQRLALNSLTLPSYPTQQISSLTTKKHTISSTFRQPLFENSHHVNTHQEKSHHPDHQVVISHRDSGSISNGLHADGTVDRASCRTGVLVPYAPRQLNERCGIRNANGLYLH